MDVTESSKVLQLPAGVEINEKYMQDFWYWVSERQLIWYKRNVLKLPKPWTSDPILRNYFFTCVYRELDAGTQYYLNKIAVLKLPKDRLFNTLAFRYFNNEPTWDFILEYFKDDHIPFGQWQHKKMAQALTRWESKGNRVFTSAFTVTGVRFGGYPDKISNVCWLIEHLQSTTPATLRRLFRSRNLRDVFDTCFNLLGFGAFLAYEVCIDLNYDPDIGFQFSEDDFVNAGPGCKRGLQYIFPERGTVKYEDLIKYLRWNQRSYFEHYGFDFHYYRGKELSLRSIEHSLCEYGKFARTKWRVLSDGRKAYATTRRYLGNK